jgi:hypothetical protein
MLQAQRRPLDGRRKDVHARLDHDLGRTCSPQRVVADLELLVRGLTLAIDVVRRQEGSNRQRSGFRRSRRCGSDLSSATTLAACDVEGARVATPAARSALRLLRLVGPPTALLMARLPLNSSAASEIMQSRNAPPGAARKYLRLYGLQAMYRNPIGSGFFARQESCVPPLVGRGGLPGGGRARRAPLRFASATRRARRGRWLA